MIEYETHKEVLKEVLRINTKPVLELGMGEGSTFLIHEISEDKKIVTLSIDNKYAWARRYFSLKTDLHTIQCFSEEECIEFYVDDVVDWGLVFIDSSSWEDRARAVYKYKDTADYLIVHDCDYFPNHNIFGKTKHPIKHKAKKMGKREYDDIFKYWIEFFVKDWKNHYPPTLLGSNKICLDDFVISDDLIVSNRSKSKVK